MQVEILDLMVKELKEKISPHLVGECILFTLIMEEKEFNMAGKVRIEGDCFIITMQTKNYVTRSENLHHNDPELVSDYFLIHTCHHEASYRTLLEIHENLAEDKIEIVSQDLV